MSAEISPASRTTRSSTREWQWGWTVAVLANFPVPLIFGGLAVSRGGLFGMLAGIGVVWLLGHLIVTRVRAVRATLVVGAAVLAPSQMIPIVQIAAGSAALGALTGRLGGPMSEVTGFLVTLLTAGQLLTVAVLCGLFVNLLSSRNAADVACARH